MITSFAIGDKCTLKKTHPCGGTVWTVVRTGADIKLCCDTCGKFVNLSRDDLRKRVKGVLSKKEENQ